ncbi:hypothetical protein GQ457_04G006910 [Hibiscus cannabinus]
MRREQSSLPFILDKLGTKDFRTPPSKLLNGRPPPHSDEFSDEPRMPLTSSFFPFFIPDSPEIAKTPRIGIRPYGVGRTKRHRPPSDRLGSEICCSPCLDDPVHRWDSPGNAPVAGNPQGRQWSNLSSDLRDPPLDRLGFGICHSTPLEPPADRWDSPLEAPIAGAKVTDGSMAVRGARGAAGTTGVGWCTWSC